MGEHPLIISYFTPGTAYETHAQLLMKSVTALGLEARIEPRPSKGTWIENCGQKPQFIRQIREAEGRPVLWIDADAVLRKPITELIGSDADLGVSKKKGWIFVGGHVYFGISDRATWLLDAWCDYCEAYPFTFDQVLLGYSWWDRMLSNAPPEVQWFGEQTYEKLRFHWWQRAIQHLTIDTAIFHKQESRTSRVRTDEPKVFGTSSVPQWWREAAIKDRPFPLSDAQRVDLGLV